MQNTNARNSKKPLLIGLFVFFLLMLLTQYLTYQKYLLNKRDRHQEVIAAAKTAKNRLQTSLYHSVSAAKTLAFIINNYGVPKDFNTVAQGLIQSNKYIDAIELVQNGVVTNVYPLQGNEIIIGHDILKDPSLNKEALKAIEKKDLFFTGPITFKRGDKGIVGRLPIFENEKFWGFSCVLITLPTLVKAMGVNVENDKNFIYQLSKLDPETGREEFFFSGRELFERENSISIDVPNGEWRLYVKPRKENLALAIIPFCVLGICFSLIGGFFALSIIKLPEALGREVYEKKMLLSNVEKRYQAIVENSLDAIFLANPDGTILEVNKAACDLFGFTEEEFKRIGRQGFIDHADPIIHEKLKSRIESGKARGELKGIKKNGTTFPIGFSSVIFENDDGEKRSSTIITDITERKKAEREIQLLVNNTEEAFILVDKSLKVVSLNNQFKNLHRDYYNREVETGAYILEYVSPEQAIVTRLIYEKVLTGEEETSEIKVNRQGGEIAIFELKYKPARDESGKIIGVFVTGSDITKRKRAEEELIAKERELSLIYNNVNDIIFMLNIEDGAKYRFASVNQSFLSITGLTRDSVVGKLVEEVIPESSLIAALKKYKQAIDTGVKVSWEETTRYRTVEQTGIVTLTPIIDHEGLYTKLVGSFYDITESKKQHSEINRIRKNQDALINGSPDLIWSIDKEYKIITCNKAYKEKKKADFGILINEGDHVLASEFGKAPNHKWKEYYQRGLSGESFTFREQNFNPSANDYEYSWISINPMYNSENELFGVACYSKDITDDIQSRIDLENAMNELNKILDYSLDVICTVDHHGNFVSVSAASMSLLGYEPDELKGRPYMDFVYKDDHQLTRLASIEVTQGINKTNFENRCVKKDGSVVPVVWSARWNKKDKVMHCIAKDASEKKGHEAILTNILESIGDAFFSVDNNYTVTYWNNVAENLLGKKKETIIGRNLWELFPDGITRHSKSNFDKVMHENHNVHFEDFFNHLEKWFEISAYPSVTGMSVYLRDITQRKLSESKLVELNNELMRHSKELMISNAELEQFAYVASHDLQEPLRMVTGFLTQLEKKYKDKLDEKANQYIYFAVDGAKRMRRILLDLLEFSRVGRTEDKVEELDLNELVKEIQVLFRKRIEEKGARLEIGELPVLLLPKSPTYQIFQNLISNALKYQKENVSPVIQIKYTETETDRQFMVTDNGIGIDPEYFDRIFILFQRLHRKEEFSGTGMGLTITKKIVENLGGKIWVESAEGKGSTFYFTIPKNIQL